MSSQPENRLPRLQNTSCFAAVCGMILSGLICCLMARNETGRSILAIPGYGLFGFGFLFFVAAEGGSANDSGGCIAILGIIAAIIGVGYGIYQCFQDSLAPWWSWSMGIFVIVIVSGWIASDINRSLRD